MKRVSIMAAAFGAAAIFFLLVTLPSRPATAAWTGDPALAARTVSGAYHIHSTQSDGSADAATIAAAAARAGLQFMILTDHGDGTRSPASPVYRHGVLCIEGVEISSSGGHYVALGMAQAPYPLGGEADAVVEDVARLGGFGVAAHPDSTKSALAWHAGDAAIDGVEWLNADSEWRNEGAIRLLIALGQYLIRPGAALASLLDRPTDTLARWDAMTVRRPVVGLAGHDAHGGGRRTEEGYRAGVAGIPAYEAGFRSFSVRVMLDAPPTGDARLDAVRLLDAIRGGRVFTAIDAVATPALIDWRATSGGDPAVSAVMGGTLPPGAATLSIHAAVPVGAEVVILQNGREMAGASGPAHTIEVGVASGAFRVEVRVPGAPGRPPVPWLVSNPIYFLRPEAVSPTGPARSPISLPTAPWRVEKDSASSGSVTAGESGASLEFRLGGGGRASQFVAMVSDLTPGNLSFERIDFEARASRPMRVSTQLRYPNGGGIRWARSFYVDPQARRVDIPTSSMVAADRQTAPMPETSSAGSLLFVVDLTNAKPGDSGQVWISNLGVGR